jgi:hypothetical protein
MPKDLIPIRLTGGINNRHTPLDLHLMGRGDLVNLVNADTTYYGEIRPLRPLTALNSTAESNAIHSLFRANTVLLVGTSTTLKYLNGTALTTLLSGLASANMSFGHVGDWVFFGEGTNKKAVYLTTPVGTDWGLAIPSAGPIVAAGASGNPNGTYTCYYRYRITLPDGGIILTALSAISTQIPVASKKISWSNIVHASFTGATSVKVDLFRTYTGAGGTFLVTTLDEGTTTYTDDLSDADLITQTAYAETGYWPPPAAPSIVRYHPGADRVFAAVDNDLYWSLAANYHVFLYDEDASEYTNVNSVFLSGEDITALEMLDEQMYIGSQNRWRRLKGTDPASWSFEDTSASKGPVSKRAAARTRWGIIYPGNDSRMWLFNGFDAVPFLDRFVFDTAPDSTCHSTFDGRFYRLFYGDSTYPELLIDLYGFPEIPPRAIKSTRSADSSFYDNHNDEFYTGGSDGFVRNGEDSSESVTITVETPEIPLEDLTRFGDMAKLVLRVDTASSDLTITPKRDGTLGSALTAINNSALTFQHVPIDLNVSHVLAFVLSIASSGSVRIQDPILIGKEDG